jgi:hypothetical protein
MIAYMRHLAPTLAIVLLASTCAGETAPGEGDSLLRAAVEKTLAAEGFHIKGWLHIRREEIESEGDYVAPDRISMSSSSDGTTPTITIVVGRNHYASEPEDPNAFRLWEMPCDVGVDTFMPALAVVGYAEGVRMAGDVFTFRADGDEGTPMEGEARVTDGYLTGLTLRYTVPRVNERVEEHWTFSDFGATVPVQPPPREQVLQDPAFDGLPLIGISTGQPPACP